MTNDQIRERCTTYYNENFPGVDAVHGLPGLESLYREAIAEGLERAAKEAEQYQGILATVNSLDYNAGYRDGNHNLMKWCRQEAARVKEGK